MSDLVEWLPACYDRAEQQALALLDAVRDEWFKAESLVDAFAERPHRGMSPSWRLADIARKRKILAEHDPEDVGGGRLRCMVCADPPQYDARWRLWPCLTVRLLAEEFDSEPGYREEWRP